MIKLLRPKAPTQLTEQVIQAKVQEYKTTEKPVWKEQYIIEKLLQMSSNKCCYCECNVTEEGKYMEVDHFHDKSDFPNEVVTWTNLLPSCKKCNGTKSDHNTVLEPIIDPSKDKPQDHLYLKNNIRFRAKENDDLGDMTISTLDLNNQEKHIITRSRISQEIATKVEDLKEKSKLVISGNRTDNRFRYKLRNDVRALLELCQPTTPYSAVKATTLTHDEYYVQLKNNLSTCGLWSEDLNELERLINEISYDIDG